MVVGPQHRPPRPLCLLMLALLALLSIFTQTFNNYGNGSNRELSSGDAFVGWRRPVSEAESGDEQGFQNDRVWRPVRLWRELLPYAVASDRGEIGGRDPSR